MARRRRNKATIPALGFLSGLDLRQIIILLGALAGGGGLLKLDANQTSRAATDQVTATASLSATAFETISELEVTVRRLEARMSALEAKGRVRKRQDGPPETGAAEPAVFDSLSPLPPTAAVNFGGNR